MKITPITKENMEKDKSVFGKEWVKTYKGFFGNAKNIRQFVKTTMNVIPNKNSFTILYAASASGLLGEALTEKLHSKGITVKLTLIDISQKHLDANTNLETRKICGDLLNITLNEKFDIILMRSSLDYFPNEKMQIQLLKRIRVWLTEEGVFINQPASLQTAKDRNCADAIYNSTNKIGKRHFQCEEDIYELYKKAGMRAKKVNYGPTLLLSEKEHLARYGTDKKDIAKIQKIINKTKSKNIKTTKTGYKIKFIFPIYAAWKN